MVEIVGNIDVAQMVLYAFWIFFAGLIWYLQAESRREGYPLESDLTGEYNRDPWLQLPRPKTFLLPHGMGTRTYPNPANRDERPIAARRTAAFPGAPLIPTGNPLVDGVGPASWAERPDHPDLTPHGTAKIAPMRVATKFKISDGSPDPRGFNVVSADGRTAGVVSDVWVDQTEPMIRYYEIETDGQTRLIPSGFAKVRRAYRGRGKELYVHALLASQYADIPTTASTDQITLLEEERIMAYFGGGNLYATPARAEPKL